MSLFSKKKDYQVENTQMSGEYGLEQPELQGAGTPMYQPTIMPSEKADLYDKIDPQEIVDYLKYRLMGYEKSGSKGEWIKPKYAKGLSELGANEITTLMLPVSSKNIIISKLSDMEIRTRTKNLVKCAMMLCMQNWKSYGITGADQIFMIKEIVLSNTFITLKQPENAGAREFLGKSTSENKNITENPKVGLGRVFRGE